MRRCRSFRRLTNGCDVIARAGEIKLRSRSTWLERDDGGDVGGGDGDDADDGRGGGERAGTGGTRDAGDDAGGRRWRANAGRAARANAEEARVRDDERGEKDERE